MRSTILTAVSVESQEKILMESYEKNYGIPLETRFNPIGNPLETHWKPN